jgi:hypothetical protein
MSIHKSLILLLSTTLFSHAVFSQRQNLGFHLNNGETYFYAMQAASNIEQEINGQQTEMAIKISGRMAFKVVDFTDSVYNMNVTYQQLAMSMRLPGTELSFDSKKKDPSDIFSRILGAMVNKPFEISMTQQGKITSVRNLTTVFEQVFAEFPELPEQQKQQLKSQLLQAYGEKAFVGSLESVTAIYPRTRVEKGSTWHVTTALETGMAGTQTITYQLKGQDKKNMIIAGTGTMQTLDKEAYVPINGQPTRYDLSGTINAQITVDATTGWIVEGKTTQTIGGNVEIKDDAGGTTIIPMTLVTELISSSN